jgi:hypothetical protein
MSRSVRKTKIFGNCSANTSEKQDKRKCNRKVRRINKVLVTHEDDEHLIGKHEAIDTWSMRKDGRHYWKDAEPGDMRK